MVPAVPTTSRLTEMQPVECGVAGGRPAHTFLLVAGIRASVGTSVSPLARAWVSSRRVDLSFLFSTCFLDKARENPGVPELRCHVAK